MAPKFVARVARLPQVLATLAARPEGMPLSELAALHDADVDELREDLFAYYTADPDLILLGLSRPHVLEFLGPHGDDEDPEVAEIVRTVSAEGAGELGVEYLAAHEVALIYSAAVSLHDVRPDPELAEAIDVLADTMLGGVEVGRRAEDADDVLRTMRAALTERRRVRLVYSRAWVPGVGERDVEPYRLERTRRGWEVDAGPVDDNGRLRTYLLSHVREAELLDDTFEPPPGLPSLLARSRLTTTVRMALRHDARWAADMYAERVTVVGESDADFTADLELLPPVDGRVGLITLAGGEDTRVLEPASLLASGPQLAEELYRHHAGA